MFKQRGIPQNFPSCLGLVAHMARILLAPHPMNRVPNSEHDRDNAPCIRRVLLSPFARVILQANERRIPDGDST